MADAVSLTDAKAIAQDGYVSGFPLIYIALQAGVMTSVAKPESGRAPFNQFDQHREFPDGMQALKTRIAHAVSM